MADHLFLRLSADGDGAVAVALNEEGRLLARPEALTLGGAARRAEGMRVTVMLPAQEVVSRVAELPATSPAKLRQMLPFKLEDEFAGDVDELHFASGERNDEGLAAVSVVDRARLDFWLGALRAAAIEPQSVCSEADAVPDTPGIVSLFLEQDQILGRRPGGAPFAFAGLGLDELWQLLAGERQDSSDLRRIVLYVDSATRRARAAEIEAWRTAVDELDIEELADGCLPRLAAGLVHHAGVNLIQGSYARRTNVAALAGPWRAAAGFLLALALLTVLGKGAVVWKLGGESERLLAEVAALCSENYATTQLNTCRADMLRRLDRLGQSATTAGVGYLEMQAAIADAGGDILAMDQMSYRNGVLTLDMIAPSIPFVESFSQSITDSGRFEIREQSTQAGAEIVTARMSIAVQN